VKKASNRESEMERWGRERENNVKKIIYIEGKNISYSFIDEKIASKKFEANHGRSKSWRLL
jgi:hypothetical protein